MKKLIFGIVVLLALAGGYVVTEKARATFNLPSFHTEWTYGSWSEWSECEPQEVYATFTDEAPQCGEDVIGTQTRHRTKICILKLGSGQNQCSLGSVDKQYEHRDCPIEVPPCEEPTPTPEVTPSPEPNRESSASVQAPMCPDGSTTNVVANPHVLRLGSEATVNFFITEGDSANVYWKEVDSNVWQHALSDLKPNSDRFVSVTVGGLDPNLGYTFGIEQKFGCGGGQRTAVVVDDPTPTLFRLSFWE